MNDFTPGPWQIFEPSGLSENVLIAVVEHDADDEGRHKSYLTRICEMADTRDEDGNAKLIAAAPDLLGVLTEVRDAIVGPVDRKIERMVTIGQRMMLGLERIEAAIAKAGL